MIHLVPAQTLTWLKPKTLARQKMKVQTEAPDVVVPKVGIFLKPDQGRERWQMRFILYMVK